VSEPNLKPRQHYVDFYDKLTVDRCRRWLQPDEKKAVSPEDAKKEELQASMRKLVQDVSIHFVVGEEYVKKDSTIREWMDRDRRRDEVFEAAVAPEDITCLTCGRLMFESSKDLYMGGSDNDTDRVLFFYDCSLGHLPRRAFFDDGEEWRHKEKVCPKCSQAITDKRTEESEERIVITSSCSGCDYTDDFVIDLTSKPEVVDPDFAKDRERFCLSEKAGQEYIQGKENLERLGKLMDEIKEKEKNKHLYDEVKKLRKLKINELEEMLVPLLEKAGYVKLQFKTPEISKDVFVPFITYDSKPERESYSSSKDLEKLLKKVLVDTNWRLATDGASYRLGMLEGRLHGYEREEDLLKLVNKKAIDK
jgi:hypothetical protein